MRNWTNEPDGKPHYFVVLEATAEEANSLSGDAALKIAVEECIANAKASGRFAELVIRIQPPHIRKD